jgi:hypothetical protein
MKTVYYPQAAYTCRMEINVKKNRRANPNKLASLGTQDTGRRQTKQTTQKTN